MASDHKDLGERLAALSKRERTAILKEAERRRSAAERRDRKRRGRNTQTFKGHEWDEESQTLGRGERGPASLHDWALRVMAERESQAGRFEWEGERREGIVVRAGSRRCTVLTDDGVERRCVLASELAENQQTSLAVGDRVSLEVRTEGPDLLRIVSERRTRLSRPDPVNPHLERVAVANVDVVCIIASAKDPPLRLGLIDRYLIAIQRGGAQALLLVNKVDLLSPEERAALEAELAPYAALSMPVLYGSAEGGEGILALRAALTGKLTAFVGHSGVGKSSLINRLHPTLALDTGETNQTIGRGRHTTTQSSLLHLPGEIRIIDTPGIRSFGMYQLKPEELRWYFPEFEGVSSRCRFADCSHDHEPGCAVREAAAQGEIPPPRFDAYLRILKSLEDPDT